MYPLQTAKIGLCGAFPIFCNVFTFKRAGLTDFFWSSQRAACQSWDREGAAKQRRRSVLKADALRASRVRLFGDGGSVAALPRVS